MAETGKTIRNGNYGAQERARMRRTDPYARQELGAMSGEIAKRSTSDAAFANVPKDPPGTQYQKMGPAGGLSRKDILGAD